MLIRAGRVIDPARRLDVVADVLIRNGRIAAIAQDIEPDVADEVVDAFGCVVCPGFVDLHTHLRYPGSPAKETIVSGTMAAAAGGFTTVCAMANTEPVVDSPLVLRGVLDVVQRDARVKVRQIAAVSCGLRGEQLTDMDALAAAGAVAFSDDGKAVWNGALMREALQVAGPLGRVLSVHEEDPVLVRGGVANAGEPARRHGLRPWPCSGEASMLKRDIALLAETGGHLHVAHVSCAETVDVLRQARRVGLAVTAEVTPHHLCLTDELLDGDPALGLGPAHPCTKVNPPLRSAMDVQATIEALADGTIDAVATDHAPHAASDKEGNYEEAAFGISSIETALPLLLDLVRSGYMNLTTLISRLTAGPANVFGLPGGNLAPGIAADVCVFNPKRTWRVTADALHSRGKNTPLAGRELQGRVVYTIVDGSIVYRA